MNASVHVFPMSARAEARRLRTIHGIRAGMHALSLELARVATLGDDEAAVALRDWARRMTAQVVRGETLAEEYEALASEAFEELEAACAAVDAQDDAIEAEESAAARWDSEHK
jgi:hypothetical protein